MKISVVIPAYNEAGLLPDCLEALSKQTRTADEIIVVDNNSTDDTADIARKYGAQVISETRQGIMPATCTGLDYATGDVIARCDADSIVPTDWLATIAKQMQNDSELVAITGPGYFYGVNRLSARAAQWWYMKAYTLLVGSALANRPLFGSNFAIRRSCWQQVQKSVHRDRSDIHDDMDISMHIDPTCRIVYDPSLAVAIAGRALSAKGLPKRYAMGFRTLMIHWPEQAPWQRWRRKWRL